jgi:hypothetical protein
VVSAKDPVVVVRIVGGLGNQMFQYACGKAVALRSGAKLYLDVSAFSRYKQHIYGLGGFPVSVPFAPFRLQTGGVTFSFIRRAGIDVRHMLLVQGFHYLTENLDLSFHENLLNKHQSVYLDGYWQSERYFREFTNDIRNDFFPYDARCSFRARFADDLPSVSLHVRRGDYLSNAQANSVHGVLDVDYYRAAVSIMAERIGPKFRVIVFSDDIDWAKDNLSLAQPMDFVSGSTELPHEDLRRMASCDHHIIANSSFSWWGGWLNPSQDKQVIAPKRWFITSQYVYDQICPAEWIRI